MNKKIITLGPKGTYSDLAASKLPASHTRTYTQTISEICPFVIKSQDFIGVIPVENSAVGLILLSLDSITTHRVSIIAEITIPISFSLISYLSSEKIKQYYIHRETFNQCSKFIQKKLKNSEPIFCESNVKTAKQFKKKKDKHLAAIVPSFLCKEKSFQKYYQKHSIEDHKNNCTRFWVLKKEVTDLNNIKEKSKISIYIEFRKDEPSLLYKTLGVFDKYKFNMTMLSSRPLPEKNLVGESWTYGFFIDFQIKNKKQEKKVLKLLEHFKKKKIYCKVLGAYQNIENMNSEEIFILLNE